MEHFLLLSKVTEATLLQVLGHHHTVARALHEDALLPLLATIVCDDRHTDAVIVRALMCLACACHSPLTAAGAIEGEQGQGGCTAERLVGGGRLGRKQREREREMRGMRE